MPRPARITSRARTKSQSAGLSQSLLQLCLPASKVCLASRLPAPLLFFPAQIQTVWHEILWVSRDLHLAPMRSSYQRVLAPDRALRMRAICVLFLHSAFFGNHDLLFLQPGFLIPGLTCQWVRSVHTLAAEHPQIS
ncbi:hypothetical protein FIBSPDRAFT_532225 [Athelia psychrophila]|uniref:Uncharacterized protein n=1 Tax=Athelia psychrophila TaxID=1759441 RepID=A0A166J8N4_9AGAM|nr:hypothetical protein FIBSPDRAFT_532225 [Fibularhizoctonia sp. CBS 109695]